MSDKVCPVGPVDSASPARKKRALSLRENSPASSEISSTLSGNTTCASLNSSRTSVPDNRSQNKLKTSLKNVENFLEQNLQNFSRPSLPQPAFPDPDPDAFEAHIRKILQRFNSTSCLAVIENLRENGKNVWKIQKEFLNSLQNLLQDACEPLDTHGLSDGHIKSIYGALISLSKVETEMACRLMALDAIAEALEAMEEPTQDAIAQATPREFAAAENLGEIFKIKFDEFLSDKSKTDRRHRIRTWREIVQTRDLQLWEDEEVFEESQTADVDSSGEGSDGLEDSSMNSIDDT